MNPAEAPVLRKYTPGRQEAARLRLSASSAETTLLHPSEISAALLAEWEVLGSNATEPNPFAEAWYVMLGLGSLAGADDIRILAVRDPACGLAGILPLCIRNHYGRLPVRHVENWLHGNAFLGTPLVKPGQEMRFWRTVLQTLDRSDWAPGFLHLVGLVEGGPVFQGLQRAAAALGRECSVVLRQDRPQAETELSAEAYLQRNLSAKRRSEYGRRRRNLAKLGHIELRELTNADELPGWCEDFLRLEQAGWKGEAGSALACSEGTSRFFREVMREAFARGSLHFIRLDLDGAPIAMQSSLVAPPGAFGFKACFDENFARFSPGLLLQIEGLTLIDREDIHWEDSCAAADHPVASLWSERRSILRVTIPLSGLRRRILHVGARALEQSSLRFRRLRGAKAGLRENPR